MSPLQALSVESYRPAPERVWIRHRPRNWPAPGGLWTDWSRRTLGRPGRVGAALPSLDRELDDVVYLPPVAAGRLPGRDRLAREWSGAGTPLVVQRLPGELSGADEGTVWDLLPVLLGASTEELLGLPRGARAVWPLVAGLTDRDELVSEGLERLVEAGVGVVQPMLLELSARARRQLAQGADESTFDRLFHGPPPSARRFSALARRHGLSPFLRRPLPRAPRRLQHRRRCAGELRLAAELSRALGRPELDAQTLLRSARWIDREDHDLAALAESGNLSIVDWFDDASRRLIEEVVRDGRSTLLSALEDEYTRLPETAPAP